MNNYLSGVFGSSPISPLQAHMAKVQDAITLLSEFFDVVIMQDFESAEKIKIQISECEKEADFMKKKIRLNLPKGLFMPFARADLLNVLLMQDRIANKAKDIAGIVVARRIIIPKKIDKKFLKFVNKCINASAQAKKAIDELDELVTAGFRGNEVKIVKKMLNKLDKIESDADKKEATIRNILFIIEKTLDPIEVIFLYKIIEDTGELADLSQRVGSRLQLMLAK